MISQMLCSKTEHEKHQLLRLLPHSKPS